MTIVVVVLKNMKVNLSSDQKSISSGVERRELENFETSIQVEVKWTLPWAF